MSEKIKRNFASLDEAMMALPKKTLRHSERVASYLKTFFLQACTEDDLYINDAKVQARLKDTYADLVYNIGYYHDVGKALLPEEYQNSQPEYSKEERALYEKHAGDSMAFIENLYRKEYKVKPFEENYVREAIAFHHELWNGSGFPNCLSGKNIPFFARMLAIVDKLDHLVCEIHSEHPFEDAMEEISANADKVYDPVLIPILRKCTKKLKKIFAANLDCTRIIPSIVPFVSLDTARPYALWYRPVEDLTNGKTLAVEAEVKFKAKKLWLTYKEVSDVISRENLRKDLGTYMALEACDIIRRLDTCGIETPYLMMAFPTKWFNYSYAVPELLAALNDSGVTPDRFCIVFGPDDFGESRANLKKSVDRLKAAGIRVLFDRLTLDGVPVVIPQEPAEPANPDEIPENGQQPVVQTPPEPQLIFHNRKKENGVITIDEILELKPDILRIGPADATQHDNDAYLDALKRVLGAKIEIMARDVEPHDFGGLFYDLAVKGATGKFVGDELKADDYIKAELGAMEN